MLKHNVTITSEQWRAINKETEENINRYASWIADDFQDPEKKAWVITIKQRYGMWCDIRQALHDCDDIVE